MMRIINKIYIWFKKVILNILGVIRDMINKDNEVEMMKVKCETARYIIEKGADGIKYVIDKSADGIKYVFGSRKTRLILAVALALSCVNIPEEKEVVKDEKQNN